MILRTQHPPTNRGSGDRLSHVATPFIASTPGPWDAALIGLAWLLYAVALTQSNLTIDVARDIAQAHLVATGADWPLRGPMIGSAVYLGPLWFYLLAPAAAAGSTVVLALWVGFLAGSKFVFGWWLGTAIAGPAAGRGVVVALTLPAWTGFELLVFSHTNLVAASVLAFAGGCLELWRGPRPGWAFWVLATGVLMLHAHPSTLPLLVLALPGLARGLRQRCLPPTRLLVAVAIAAGLFLPPWLAPSGGNVTLGAETLLPTRQTLLAVPLTALGLGRALVVEGPSAVTHLIGAWSAPAATTIGLLSITVAVAGFAGLALQSRRLRVPILAGLAMLALSLLFIALVRPQTPFYMAYGPSTVLAVLAGLGLGRWLGAALGGLVATVLLIALLGTQGHALRELSSRGVLDVPVALTDIASRSRPAPGPGAEQLSPVAADRIATHLCMDPRPVHGPLAVALDLAYGIPLRMRCGLGLAGLMTRGGRGTEALGLPRQAWVSIGLEPDIALGQWGLAGPVSVLRTGVVRWADYRSSRDYPPRLWADGAIEERIIEVTLAPGDLLSVTSLEHVFGHNAPTVLKLGQVEIKPAWRSEWSSVWRPSLDGPRTLTLTLSGRSLDAVEVVVLGESRD